VKTSGGDRYRIQTSHLLGRACGEAGAAAPSHDCAVADERQTGATESDAGFPSRGNRRDVGQTKDRHRAITVVESAIAQLAKIVRAPGHHGAVGKQRKRVLACTSNGRDVGEARDGEGERATLTVVEPMPSWPKPLYPQAITVPSESSAKLCALPAAIAIALARPLTGAGAFLRVCVVPSPSCPSSLLPQDITVPSAINARL
jgi:hypothetical protein